MGGSTIDSIGLICFTPIPGGLARGGWGLLSADRNPPWVCAFLLANFYLEAFLCRAKRGSVKNEKRIIPSGVGVAGGVRFASGEQVSLYVGHVLYVMSCTSCPRLGTLVPFEGTYVPPNTTYDTLCPSDPKMWCTKIL
jgi:hypothetical protein